QSAVAPPGPQRMIDGVVPATRAGHALPNHPSGGKAPLMGKTLDRRTSDASDIAPAWKLHDAFETYGVRNWGKGYFGINKLGHLTVHPDKDPERSIDLKELIDQLRDRGIQPPLLLRFTDILRHRITEIAGAFRKAMDEYEYTGAYNCVYPIKVNQQRHVVEEVLHFGREFG